MFTFQIYVVGVSKENSLDSFYNVRMRLFKTGASLQPNPPVPGMNTNAAIADMTLQVVDADIEPWKEATGKFSQTLTPTF